MNAAYSCAKFLLIPRKAYLCEYLDVQVVMSSTQAPDPEEEALYASPEELLSNGTRATPKSDVYSLGMLFFELFNPSTDSVDRKRALEALRHRILPSHVLRVSLHPQPS